MSDFKINTGMDEAKLVEINDALAKLQAAKGELNKAKKAGLDVSSQETALLDTEAKLKRVKDAYYPGR